MYGAAPLVRQSYCRQPHIHMPGKCKDLKWRTWDWFELSNVPSLNIEHFCVEVMGK